VIPALKQRGVDLPFKIDHVIPLNAKIGSEFV